MHYYTGMHYYTVCTTRQNFWYIFISPIWSTFKKFSLFSGSISWYIIIIFLEKPENVFCQLFTHQCQFWLTVKDYVSRLVTYIFNFELKLLSYKWSFFGLLWLKPRRPTLIIISWVLYLNSACKTWTRFNFGKLESIKTCLCAICTL